MGFGPVPDDFFTDRRLRAVTRAARGTAARILAIVCPEGRFDGDPWDLARRIGERDEEGLAEDLRDLEVAGWVAFYSATDSYGASITVGHVIGYHSYTGLPEKRKFASKRPMSDLPPPPNSAADADAKPDGSPMEVDPKSDGSRPEVARKSPGSESADRVQSAECRVQSTERRTTSHVRGRGGAREPEAVSKPTQPVTVSEPGPIAMPIRSAEDLDWPDGTRDAALAYLAQQQAACPMAPVPPECILALSRSHPGSFSDAAMSLVADAAARPESMTRSPLKWLRKRCESGTATVQRQSRQARGRTQSRPARAPTCPPPPPPRPAAETEPWDDLRDLTSDLRDALASDSRRDVAQRVLARLPGLTPPPGQDATVYVESVQRLGEVATLAHQHGRPPDTLWEGLVAQAGLEPYEQREWLSPLVPLAMTDSGLVVLAPDRAHLEFITETVPQLSRLNPHVRLVTA